MEVAFLTRCSGWRRAFGDRCGARGRCGPLGKKVGMGKVMKMKQAVMDAADAMIRAPNVHGRQASGLYVKSLSGVGWQARGYAGCWTSQLSWMVPNVAHRVLMRRMMMGSIPYLRANVLKWGKGFKGWTAGDKGAWMQCPCGCGVQDALHFFLECG